MLCAYVPSLVKSLYLYKLFILTEKYQINRLFFMAYKLYHILVHNVVMCGASIANNSILLWLVEVADNNE